MCPRDSAAGCDLRAPGSLVSPLQDAAAGRLPGQSAAPAGRAIELLERDISGPTGCGMPIRIQLIARNAVAIQNSRLRELAASGLPVRIQAGPLHVGPPQLPAEPGGELAPGQRLPHPRRVRLRDAKGVVYGFPPARYWQELGVPGPAAPGQPALAFGDVGELEG